MSSCSTRAGCSWRRIRAPSRSRSPDSGSSTHPSKRSFLLLTRNQRQAIVNSAIDQRLSMEWQQPIGDSVPRKEIPPFAPGTGLAERGPKPTHTKETAMFRFTTTMMIFALALGLQSAHAAPLQDVPSVVVHFADLDLLRSEGATVLYQRLKGAAETVCAPLDDR